MILELRDLFLVCDLSTGNHKRLLVDEDRDVETLNRLGRCTEDFAYDGAEAP